MMMMMTTMTMTMATMSTVMTGFVITMVMVTRFSHSCSAQVFQRSVQSEEKHTEAHPLHLQAKKHRIRLQVFKRRTPRRCATHDSRLSLTRAPRPAKAAML